MMRVLIHAGNPKTGSSSLQQYLHSHRNELAQVGVCYPDFGHRAHWLLTAAFAPFGKGSRTAKRIARSKEEIELDDFRAECRGILAGFTGDLLIFSNEGLSHEPRAENFINFVKEHRPDAEIVVLDYIRDPLSHFPSATQQNLKAEGDRTLYPAHWLSSQCVRGLYLLNVVPELVVFRVFSSGILVNGDIVDDFAAFVKRRFEIELPPNKDKAPRNASHSGAACAVLSLRDLAPQAPLGQNDRKKLGKPLRETDRVLKPPKLKLPSNFREAILANNQADWNRLIDLTDYDEQTRASLKLPVAEMPVGIEQENSGLWVIRSLDETFVRTLIQNIEETLPGSAGKRLKEWLICAVNETTELHGVTIEEKSSATIGKLARHHRRREKREIAAAAEGDQLAVARRVAARDRRASEEKAIAKAARQRVRKSGATVE